VPLHVLTALEGKGTHCSSPHYEGTWKTQLHSFLTLAFGRGEWPALCSAYLNYSIHQVSGWVDPEASLDITQK